jgi:hypothetical protein
VSSVPRKLITFNTLTKILFGVLGTLLTLGAGKAVDAGLDRMRQVGENTKAIAVIQEGGRRFEGQVMDRFDQLDKRLEGIDRKLDK